MAAPAETLRSALGAGAVLVDIRKSSEREEGQVAAKAVHAEWDGASLPLDALPSDKGAALIIHCRSGTRAAGAITFLAGAGYTNTINGGGPNTPEQWEVLTSA
mmetsp:Transcript_63114/g.199711  ORF Transcript_63114/g.199711 Transcript_63114/m.199711 type:complete len:103 (+) Transcript_63114:274-582(+)